MGRFSSTVDFYAKYREPYPATFFETVAMRLALRGNESLLDVGCGPGLLAIGFAPYVRHSTGLDPEPAMIDAAMTAAAAAGLPIRFLSGRIEEFTMAESFDIVTIGRALHWLDQGAAVPVLERIVSPSGRIVICGAFSIESPKAPWTLCYEDVRRSYETDTEEMRQRYKIDPKVWFAGSGFEEGFTTEVRKMREVSIPELVCRALSKSNTSPATLGDRRSAFEADITAAVEPYAHDGFLEEEILATATIFARSES
jgi:ubiquinone/menaquinone biosynthesis C-methylase UbiE